MGGPSFSPSVPGDQVACISLSGSLGPIFAGYSAVISLCRDRIAGLEGFGAPIGYLEASRLPPDRFLGLWDMAMTNGRHGAHSVIFCIVILGVPIGIVVSRSTRLRRSYGLCWMPMQDNTDIRVSGSDRNALSGLAMCLPDDCDESLLRCYQRYARDLTSSDLREVDPDMVEAGRAFRLHKHAAFNGIQVPLAFGRRL